MDVCERRGGNEKNFEVLMRRKPARIYIKIMKCPERYNKMLKALFFLLHPSSASRELFKLNLLKE